MDFAKHYEICSPGVIAEDFDGDIVILNLEDGRYFSLHGCGPHLWAALLSGATPQSILSGARASLAESANAFFNRLFELQLIRAVDAAAEGDVPVVDWTRFKDVDKPEIEIFEDLAELIMADPVHDVDTEAGWPLRKAA